MDEQLYLTFEAESFAHRWYEALRPTAYSPESSAAVEAKLGALAQRATELLRQDVHSRLAAEQIGAQIAQLNYISGDALGTSLRMLGDAWLAESFASPGSLRATRVPALLGDIASGYFRAASGTILNQQEKIREAQLVSLVALHKDLQEKKDRLQIAAEQLRTLREIDAAILASESVVAIAETASRYIRRLILCENLVIIVSDLARQSFAVLAEYGRSGSIAQRKWIRDSLDGIEWFHKLREGELIHIDDLAKIENLTPGMEASLSNGARSVLVLPLMAMGEFEGVIALSAAEVGYFTDTYVEFLQQIAGSLAVAVHNRRLLETERKARQEAETLREVAASINSRLEREELLVYVLRQLRKVLPYDAAFILLWNERGPQIFAQQSEERVAGEALIELEVLPPNILRVKDQSEPVIVADSRLDPEWIQIPGAEKVRSWLGVPLVSQDGVVGILCVDKFEPNFYDEAAANLGLTFANQAMIALENARLYGEVRQFAKQLQNRVVATTLDLALLYEVAAITVQHSELQPMLQAVLERIVEALDYPSATIHVLDKGQGYLDLLASVNLEPSLIEQLEEIASASRLRDDLLSATEPIVIEDVGQDERFAEIALPETIGSYVGMPFRVRGEATGIISLLHRQSYRLQEERVRLVASIADHLSIAIDNVELRRRAEELAALEERERLARDLHDSATQSLFSLTLFAAAARDKIIGRQFEGALQDLDDIRHTANQTHRELRLLLYELGSPEPLEEGLTQALQRRLRAVEGRSGIKVTFRDQNDLELTPNISHALFQIASEALNNALKHSGATCVSVTLENSETDVNLTISDDGTGFTPGQLHDGPGRGLANMLLRAERLGGCLSIASSENQGTVIAVSIPVESGWDPMSGDRDNEHLTDHDRDC